MEADVCYTKKCMKEVSQKSLNSSSKQDFDSAVITGFCNDGEQKW